MTKKPKDLTQTTEFEVEGIEEAYAPAPVAKSPPGGPWQPPGQTKLQVEKPPELLGRHEPMARIWILERRARGILALLRRWLVGKTRR